MIFDEFDEKAREIVAEFYKHYGSYSYIEGPSIKPEARVWLLATIACALREAAKGK